MAADNGRSPSGQATAASQSNPQAVSSQAGILSAGALLRALAKRDEVAGECPIDHPHIHAGPNEDRFRNCVRCGSGPSGACWVKVAADSDFLNEVRAIAQAMSAGTAKTAQPVEGDSPPARSGTDAPQTPGQTPLHPHGDSND